MVDIRPFRGVRFNTQRFGADITDLICPPYDVISQAETAALLGRNPWNMVRLEGPEVSAPGGNRYEDAAQRFATWLAEDVLIADSEPTIYAYRVTFMKEGRRTSRRGLMAALRLAPWSDGDVLPHEKTHAGPKEDRLALLQACKANFSPIWCLYDDTNGATERLWSRLEGGAPSDIRATDDDGVVHDMWRVSDPRALDDLRQGFAAGPVYIADGHHRYETALHYRDEAAEESGGEQDADAGWNFALTYFVEASDPELVVLGTHRIVAGAACSGVTAESLRKAIEDRFDLDDVDSSPSELLAELDRSGGTRPAFGVWAPGYGLRGIARLRGADALDEAAAPGHSLPWRKLDLAALHALAIDRIFPRGSQDLFAGGELEYTREVADVARTHDSDPRLIAFLVRTTPVQQVMAVADAGDRMPEKSTYFYPKPASGLVIARCDDNLAPSP